MKIYKISAAFNPKDLATATGLMQQLSQEAMVILGQSQQLQRAIDEIKGISGIVQGIEQKMGTVDTVTMISNAITTSNNSQLGELLSAINAQDFAAKIEQLRELPTLIQTTNTAIGKLIKTSQNLQTPAIQTVLQQIGITYNPIDMIIEAIRSGNTADIAEQMMGQVNSAVASYQQQYGGATQ